MENKTMKYQTVEGFPVVRDGVYETRDGDKAVVLGFLNNPEEERFRVVGYVNGKNSSQYIGYWTRIGYGDESTNRLGDDLMRPWKEPTDNVNQDHISEEGKMVQTSLSELEKDMITKGWCRQEFSKIAERVPFSPRETISEKKTVEEPKKLPLLRVECEIEQVNGCGLGKKVIFVNHQYPITEEDIGNLDLYIRKKTKRFLIITDFRRME